MISEHPLFSLFVTEQEKLERRLDDTHYGLEARIIKLEELLADSRTFMSDMQTVSVFFCLATLLLGSLAKIVRSVRLNF